LTRGFVLNLEKTNGFVHKAGDQEIFIVVDHQLYNWVINLMLGDKLEIKGFGTWVHL
jgi:hypothetical protein